MRNCSVPSSCQDGRKQTFLPASLLSEPLFEKGLSRGLRSAQLWFRLKHAFQNGDCESSHDELVRSRSSRVCQRGLWRSFNPTSSCSDWCDKGSFDIRLIMPGKCGAYKGKERGCSKFLPGTSSGGCGEDGNGIGRGHGSGGSGWHWGSGRDDGGDEGSNWSCQWQDFFFLLLGLFDSYACSKALIPALFLQLFLQRGLIAYADSITSPLKPSPIADGNGSKNCDEKAKMCRSCDGHMEPDAVFEVQGGVWRRLLIDTDKDEFIVQPVKDLDKDGLATHGHGLDHREILRPFRGLDWALRPCLDFVKHVLLPNGYPDSVTGDYLNYTLWRMGQNIASQINGVLTTQALLYAVGLGKGAIPTAAAVNWVLKDGVGYLSKILLANYGRHFDVHPKGWRLLADLLENASYALELLTPLYPHLFVYLGAAAGAGKSAAGLIQAATRSCFYAGFAAQRNFAEVIAKGEAQGMVSKFLGIALGIAISAYVGASGPTLVVTFLTVTGIHMFCNLKSYQAVQLRTLNPYRACLVFGEYIRGGVVASVGEVNAAEPIFTEVPFRLFKHGQHEEYTGNLLSLQTKEDAAIITSKLNLGVSFPNVIRSQTEADELFRIYHDEQYVLAERQSTYQALLKEGATSHDLLKLMLQVCYFHQLKTGPAAAGDNDFHINSPIEISYRLAVDNFDLVQKQLSSAGWSISDGLIARPLPYRLLNVSL